jgi:hypothetical protein
MRTPPQQRHDTTTINHREYRVWDAAEEQALRSGVQKHGLGAWERIRTDAEFHVLL